MNAVKCFVHIRLEDDWDNFSYMFKYIPHKGDRFSLGLNDPIYEVEYTLFNCFDDCDYEIEVYAHQINP